MLKIAYLYLIFLFWDFWNFKKKKIQIIKNKTPYSLLSGQIERDLKVGEIKINKPLTFKPNYTPHSIWLKEYEYNYDKDNREKIMKLFG